MTSELPEVDVDEKQLTEPNVVDIQTKSILKKKPLVKGNQISHARWIEQGIFTPFAYSVDSKGLVKASINADGETKNELFAGPIAVLATTANPDGTGGGLVIEIENKRGKFVNLSIPLPRLYEDPKLLAQELTSHNFYLQPGREKELLIYLANCDPSEQRISVSQTGWAHAEDPEKLVFVSPATSTEPGYHFQPERNSPTNQSMTKAGDLKDWVQNVFTPSPYPLLVVFSALSAPLLKFASMPTGGFHFYGGSSSGKTTLAQIAASCFGSGADPAEARQNPYIKRWNTTPNALEGTASAHNDLPLIMDELGSVDARNYARLIYDLSGGQGKSAMDANRNLRKCRTWQTVLISTGEISSQTKLEENQYGKKAHAKAGALIRLIDIAVKPSIFSSREQVDKIKRSCTRYYGTLGPAFISALAANFTESTLRQVVQDNIDKAIKRYSSSHPNLNPLQERALKHFALAETAGMLLVHQKLIPGLTATEVRNCIDEVVADWLPLSAGLTDAERSIVALKDFILKFRDSRFKSLDAHETVDSSIKLNIAGLYSPSKGLFYLYPESFAEATGGEARVTANALREKKLLVTEKNNRFTSRITADFRRITVYAIKQELLDEDERETEQQE